MIDQTRTSATDYVGVFANGAIVYVSIADRKKFDEIQGLVTDHTKRENGHRVLTKSVGSGVDQCTVIFQHWMPADPAAAEVKGAVQWNG